MNICLLTGTFHPQIGGGETYAKTIAAGMCAMGHTVFVITDRPNSSCPDYEQIGGMHIFRTFSYKALIEDPDKSCWEQAYFALPGEIANLLRHHHIDIIHANSLECAIIGSMLALTIQVPLVCSFHEQEPEAEAAGEGKCRLVFSQLPVQIFLAGSRFYYDKAIAYGADSARLKLIYHGVDLDNIYPGTRAQARQAFQVQPDDIFIVCAARLKQRKGLLELIRAIPGVKKNMPHIRVLIAGSCHSASRQYATNLYKEIELLDLTGVVSINEQLHLSDMSEVYTAADIVVQPSYSEGLGLALLEAMASNKPVIGTTISSIEEIITSEQNGLLIPPGDVSALGDAIIRLATDHQCAQKLAKKGYEHVKTHFNIRRMIKETEQSYKTAMQVFTSV
ncbi:glycosyltransferase family 4 protein [Dictyobacter kobayashii]|uniref:Glycosyl transferase family 1 n=1 Tax=Dictyobacter kobayashii TaxID=2014872 RepID=A0A402AC74_9CHLR|nr:glycosyltransferase family 4 protein [Dictyobacter kobayashii]GCE16697.1 hypothetical protein KDK_04970 [Dictyobacter kobayashii]